jgi:Fe-S oxidoreductase
VAQAAVEVLERAGFRVTIPRNRLCCGRPLYDFGFLRQARGYLQKILDELSPQLSAGTIIVGLEPSCLSVLRDEVRNMFPNDRAALRLSHQSITLSDFLQKHAAGFDFPSFGGNSAIVQAHCHHKAVLGFESEKKLLKLMDLNVDEPELGCCGMAGSFGFEKSHYDISMKIAERALLPAIRSSDQRTVLIADGFSCRTQIEQATGRQPLHLAQIIKMGLQKRERSREGNRS